MTAIQAIRLIKNGRVIDPANDIDEVRDLLIDENGILSSNSIDESSLSKENSLDASGHWVIPGLVDLAARFREPGHEHKGNIRSESAAALSGGITSVCLPPDTLPAIDTPAVVDLIQQRAQSCISPHIHTLGAMTLGLNGEQLSELGALKTAGCVGISNASHPIHDTQFMRNIMEYAFSHDLKVFLDTTDKYLGQGGCAHEGKLSTRMGLNGIPAAAEIITISRDLTLVETTGVSAHFCHLSTARSVELIAEAQQRGLAVTADVSAHQLFLTTNDVSSFNSNTHVLPPLRSERDRDALRQGVADGTIQAICSDHQPHEADAKLAPFAETEPGIAALETLLPLCLKLVHEKQLSVVGAIRAVTQNPTQILGINSGRLSTGSAADITIINPQQNWVFESAASKSSGKNSPFDQWPFQGVVTHTVVGGKLVYSADNL